MGGRGPVATSVFGWVGALGNLNVWVDGGRGGGGGGGGGATSVFGWMGFWQPQGLGGWGAAGIPSVW
jgi:hypothetical protein